MSEDKTDQRGMNNRPTEPMPRSFAPFWRLLLALGLLTATLGLVAFVIDRLVLL